MTTRKRMRKVDTWIRPINLHLDKTHDTCEAPIKQRSVCIQVASGYRMDLWLEDDGSLHMVPSTPKTEIIVTRGAGGDGFEVRVEKIR